MLVLQKFPLLLLMPLLLGGRLHSQNYSTQKTQVFVVNVLSNALIGGIGGTLNKHKGEKAYKAFIRNFLKGGAGGLVKYIAKYQTYYLSYNVLYAPVNRLQFFLGHSIVTNAAMNRAPLHTYYCDFYGLDFRIRLAEEQKIKVRLSLATLGSALYFASLGYELDLSRCLEYGLLFFNARHSYPYFGKAVFNCIAIETRGNQINQQIVPHEIVHTYQMYDGFPISGFYHKKQDTLLNKSAIYRFLSKYVSFDYEPLFFSVAYYTQPRPWHFQNYFEFEAEHFKTRAYVRRY
jgi:hypothetical protein